LPWLHRLLVENNTNFWRERGASSPCIRSSAGVRFSTPICFEDTFGYLSRAFVRQGAELIVNLTNDLWSKAEPSAMQHMAMAVFRAVENRRSLVRSTNGGMTTIIDPERARSSRPLPAIQGGLPGR
jgi:apolipoprotein N-acyltransferase